MKASLTKQIQQIAPAFASLMENPCPSLGIDFDGCVDECPLFFKLLTACWPGKVVVITWRTDRTKAESDLANFGIKYDELVLVASFEAKAAVIAERGILVFFDDQPEVLKHIPATVNVLLVRNGGNFDFEGKLWLFSEATGRNL